MKRKFNWGTGLVLALALFIAAMTWVMVKASKHNNDLVTSDYYAQELTYQKTIERKRNALALASECRLEIREGLVWLAMPKELQGQKAQVEVHLYAVTNAEKDFVLSENNWTVADLALPGDKLSPGRWQAKVTLDLPTKGYYFEPVIVLP